MGVVSYAQVSSTMPKEAIKTLISQKLKDV